MSYAWETYDGPEIPAGVELHESVVRTIFPEVTNIERFLPFVEWFSQPLVGDDVFTAGRRAVLENQALLDELSPLVDERIVTRQQRMNIVKDLIARIRAAVVHASRLRRAPGEIAQCFDPAQPRSVSFQDCERRVSSGVAAAFALSSEREISASLAPLAGGCLCWGTAACIADPQSYDGFSDAFFDVVRITGSTVEVAELFVMAATRCFAVATRLTLGDIDTLFPETDYTRYGENIGESAFVEVLSPMTLSNGTFVKGAVWVRDKGHHRYGTLVDLGETGEFVPVGNETRLAMPDPHSEIFAKARFALETYGCSAEPANFVALCYESAIIEHLRTLGRDVFRHLFARLENVPTVQGFIAWNQSGELDVSGHIALAVPQIQNGAPALDAPPTFITTNMHNIASNVKLFGARIGDLISGNQHAGRVLAAWIKRVDLVRLDDPLRAPGADLETARRQVWIGSKWTHEERKAGLRSIFIYAIALRQILATFMGLRVDAYVRPLDSIELFDALSDDDLEDIKQRIDHARRWLERLRDAKLWNVCDFTPHGAFERLLRESRMQHIRAPLFAAKAFARFDPKPAFYFCCIEFFGSIVSSVRLADKAFQRFLSDAIQGNVEEEEEEEQAEQDETDSEDTPSRHVIEALSRAYADEELEAERIAED
jgi:hypothetical protein